MAPDEPEVADPGPPRTIVLGPLALFTVLGLLLFDPRLFAGGDNVVYYLLAKALATGHGYVALYEPGQPPHTLYPPGYPLLLVPVIWLGGSFWLGKALSFAAAGASLVIAARYLWRRLDPRDAPAGVLAFALLATASYSTFLIYSHWTLSEMAYLAVSLGALTLAERSERGPRAWVPAALLAGGGVLIRTAALPLCLAVPYQVWRSRGRRAGLAAAAIALAPLAAWAARNRLVAPDAPGYLSYFFQVDSYQPDLGTLTLGGFVARVAFNAAIYLFLEIPRTLWPFLPGLGAPVPPAGYVVGLVMAPLAIYGLARQARGRGVRAGEVYVVLTAGVLAAWQWQGDRFLLPVAPLLLAYVGTGALGIASWMTRTPERGSRGAAAVTVAKRQRQRKRAAPGRPARLAPDAEGPAPGAGGWGRAPDAGGRGGAPGTGGRDGAPDAGGWSRPRQRLAAVLVVLTILPNVAYALLHAPEQVSVTVRHLRGDHLAGYDPTVRDFFAASEWLGANSPPEALVVSRKPQFTYLFSGRRSVLYPYGPPERIEEAVRASGAEYLIYDRLGASAEVYLRPYLLAHLDDYAARHSEGDPPTMVFSRVRR